MDLSKQGILIALCCFGLIFVPYLSYDSIMSGVNSESWTTINGIVIESYSEYIYSDSTDFPDLKISSTTNQQQNSNFDPRDNTFHFTYAYTINQTEYHSSRIYVSHGLFPPVELFGLLGSRDFVQNYSVNDNILVYVNPDNPKDSALITGLDVVYIPKFIFVFGLLVSMVIGYGFIFVNNEKEYTKQYLTITQFVINSVIIFLIVELLVLIGTLYVVMSISLASIISSFLNISPDIFRLVLPIFIVFVILFILLRRRSITTIKEFILDNYKKEFAFGLAFFFLAISFVTSLAFFI